MRCRLTVWVWVSLPLNIILGSRLFDIILLFVYTEEKGSSYMCATHHEVLLHNRFINMGPHVWSQELKYVVLLKMAVQLFWYQLHKNQISSQHMEVFTLYIYTKETNAQLLIYVKIYIVHLYLFGEKYFQYYGNHWLIWIKLWKGLAAWKQWSFCLNRQYIGNLDQVL